ncbi:hypothetical protein LXL04_005345 [Taraxacum kok-saghyz]
MSGSQSTSEEEGVRNFMKVELHYNGMFAPKPFAYLNDEVMTIEGVDFGALNYLEFRDVLSNVVKGPCEDVHYCSKKDTLAEGIRRINNYVDYTDFLVAGYENPPDYTLHLPMADFIICFSRYLPRNRIVNSTIIQPFPNFKQELQEHSRTNQEHSRTLKNTIAFRENISNLYNALGREEIWAAKRCQMGCLNLYPSPCIYTTRAALNK